MFSKRRDVFFFNPLWMLCLKKKILNFCLHGDFFFRVKPLVRKSCCSFFFCLFKKILENVLFFFLSVFFFFSSENSEVIRRIFFLQALGEREFVLFYFFSICFQIFFYSKTEEFFYDYFRNNFRLFCVALQRTKAWFSEI